MRLLRVVAFSVLAATAGIGISFGQTPATTVPAAKPAVAANRQGPIRRRFPRPVRNRPTPKGCTGRNGRSFGASANAKVARHRELNAGDRPRFARASAAASNSRFPPIRGKLLYFLEYRHDAGGRGLVDVRAVEAGAGEREDGVLQARLGCGTDN